MKPTNRPHILLFEPRTEGHHLSWLRYITEDLLSLDFPLTLAVDCYSAARERIQNILLAPDLDRLKLLSVFDEKGRWRGGGKIAALAECFKASGADEVFLHNFDEVASALLRRAAFGIFPARELQGRINAVYLRPRFFLRPTWPPGNFLKRTGFRKLSLASWFKRLYLLDEYLLAELRENTRIAPDTYFLPDPWSGNFSHQAEDARRVLRIPSDKFVFLCYGIGARRKGLHVAIRALLDASVSLSCPDLFLLCAGKIADDREIRVGLETLVRTGRARVIDRYVSDQEEELSFAATDVVLLPYLQHFGSSGVLSRAAAAGKMVIASDEGLIARRIRAHELGLLFSSGNHHELAARMREARVLSEADLEKYKNSGLRYAATCSRPVFRKALHDSLLS